MKLEKRTATEVTLTLTADELRLLNNAMNESLEALGEDEEEFQNRMGSSSQKVEELLTAVNTLVQQMG
jgi:hypothetical protein